MIIIVEDRQLVRSGLSGLFQREGIADLAVSSEEFSIWLDGATTDDLGAVRGCVLGQVAGREAFVRRLRTRIAAPLVGVNETGRVNGTLDLFDMGCDDVVRVPVHPREVLVRIATVERRALRSPAEPAPSRLCIFFDGRDPLVDGAPIELPRREKRILEHLARRRGARVTKAQLFNAVYGVMEEEVDEAVVESHVSKLRKKLKSRLGFDPIDARRFLGYMLTVVPALVEATHPRPSPARLGAPAYA